MKVIPCLAFVLFSASAAAQTWTAVQPMPEGRIRHRAEAGTDPSGINRVYVFSGGSESQSSATVYGYNPLTNTWASFASLPTPRHAAASASLNGRIYVIGGFNGGFSNGLATVEAYQTNTNSWSAVAPLPVTTSSASAASFNGKLYVFGGYQPNSGNVLSSTYEYNPTLNTWSLKAAMPQPASGTGAARACNGRIYVIGNGVNYEYNPTDNTWAYKTPPPSTQGGRGLVIGSDQRIYLINERTYNTSSDPVIHHYRFTNDTWYQSPNNIRGYTSVATAALGNRLYVTGGTVRFGPYTDNAEQSSALQSCLCWRSRVICLAKAEAVVKDDLPLRLTKLEPGGGVSVEHENTPRVSVAWEPLVVQEGTRVSVTGLGAVGGEQDQEVGSVSFTQEGSSVRVWGDFSALGASSWRVEAYAAGRLVAKSAGSGPLAGLLASSMPSAAGVAQSATGEASLVVNFARGALLKAEGFEANADELRIVAQSGRLFGHADRVRLNAERLSEISITAVTTSR